jgi:hypothetical protein
MLSSFAPYIGGIAAFLAPLSYVRSKRSTLRPTRSQQMRLSAGPDQIDKTPPGYLRDQTALVGGNDLVHHLVRQSPDLGRGLAHVAGFERRGAGRTR